MRIKIQDSVFALYFDRDVTLKFNSGPIDVKANHYLIINAVGVMTLVAADFFCQFLAPLDSAIQRTDTIIQQGNCDHVSRTSIASSQEYGAVFFCHHCKDMFVELFDKDMKEQSRRLIKLLGE